MDVFKSVNWRRGFFRFWVALSLLWIGLIVVFVRPWEFNPQEPRNYKITTIDNSIIKGVLANQVDCWEEIDPNYFKPREYEWSTELGSNRTVEETNQLLKKHKASLEECYEKKLEEHNKGEQKRTLVRYMELAAGAGLPPLVALLIFFVIRWIFRGFY